MLAIYFGAVCFVILTLQTKPLVNQQNYHQVITPYKQRYLVWEIMLYIPSTKVCTQEKFQAEDEIKCYRNIPDPLESEVFSLTLSHYFKYNEFQPHIYKHIGKNDRRQTKLKEF